MSAGAVKTTNFARATRSVLEHLSATSGLRTWALCRVDDEGSYTLSVLDPRGEIHAHERIPAPLSRSTDHWVSAPVHLPDGHVFGELVGFDPKDFLYIRWTIGINKFFVHRRGIKQPKRFLSRDDAKAHAIRYGASGYFELEHDEDGTTKYLVDATKGIDDQ